MLRDDFQRFRAVMTGMAKVYERELDGLLLDAYWIALRDWSLEDFERAAGELMRSSKFMPRPADFSELRRAHLPTKGEAWASVLGHLRGAYRHGGLTPEIDRAVAAIGGYRALATMNTAELPWMERRFAEHYADMADVADARAALGCDAISSLPGAALPRLT